MTWKYTAVFVANAADKLTLEHFWNILSDIKLMEKYDHDCYRARMDDGVEPKEGETVFITMHNNKTTENPCKITKWKAPSVDEVGVSSSTGIHLNFAVPLGLLSFEYDAVLDHQTKVVTLHVTTAVSGFLGGLYSLMFRSMIVSGCDHMAASIPAMAKELTGTAGGGGTRP